MPPNNESVNPEDLQALVHQSYLMRFLTHLFECNDKKLEDSIQRDSKGEIIYEAGCARASLEVDGCLRAFYRHISLEFDKNFPHLKDKKPKIILNGKELE